MARVPRAAEAQLQRHKIAQEVRKMYIDNNYDMNEFDARVEAIQASQIFDKPLLMSSNDLVGDNRACDLQLCGVPFKIHFILDHSARTINFSLFLL